MNSDKVNHVIDMIKDMDLENKLRLAICMIKQEKDVKLWKKIS